ncbi:MAG: hypothetical protein V7727_21945, partial [Sneathiella sp.]
MRNFLYKLTSSFARSGYTVELKDDMREFAALRSNTPDHAFVVPTFDFEQSDQHGSRWLKVTDDKGDTAAFAAFKEFHTDNL